MATDCIPQVTFDFQGLAEEPGPSQPSRRSGALGVTGDVDGLSRSAAEVALRSQLDSFRLGLEYRPDADVAREGA